MELRSRDYELGATKQSNSPSRSSKQFLYNTSTVAGSIILSKVAIITEGKKWTEKDALDQQQ